MVNPLPRRIPLSWSQPSEDTPHFPGCSISEAGTGCPQLTATDLTEYRERLPAPPSRWWAHTWRSPSNRPHPSPPEVPSRRRSPFREKAYDTNAVVTTATDTVYLGGRDPCRHATMVSGVANFGSPCTIDIAGNYTLDAFDASGSSGRRGHFHFCHGCSRHPKPSCSS